MNTFACAINCIDGRAQPPVIEWVKFNADVMFVDIVTAPGLDGLLAENESTKLDAVYENVMISVRVHSPAMLAVVGHFDCVANPVSAEDHLKDIKKAAETVAGWHTGIRVVGLFVNEFGSVDKICDTSVEESLRRSFL